MPVPAFANMILAVGLVKNATCALRIAPAMKYRFNIENEAWNFERFAERSKDCNNNA